MTTAERSVRKPALGRMALLFLRVGNLTFGGGDPTMAVLEREMVERRGWITPAQYAVAYALARITPGTNLLAFCAGVASIPWGWRGAAAVMLAVTVPSSVLVVWITVFYEFSTTNLYATAALSGLVAGAAGMMGSGAWRLMRPYLRRGRWPRMIVISATAFLLLNRNLLGPVWILLLAAIAGYFWREKGGGA
ncbi:MAG: chromate transporter [Acidobacteria bacterium]|nr:chromate transporter [Acidobacteriota bacterium]